MDTIEEVLQQYTPMISALIRKLHIYRDFETYRQIGEVALWQAWLRFDETKGDFTPFAYRSIHGAMLDELNRENRFSIRFTLMENPGAEEPANPLLENKLPEWLESIRLSAQEKSLLEDLFINSESIRKLAEQQGLSVSGLKKRKGRALEKIRNAMPDDVYP
ncbi:sigma-70 family RNA polymerase sigma factor [Planococcus koreensis]|uniref:sigma-70 family RNA polymerase sigma factor n=1 Tax=Planococcus koreensis TaxID=112331 RepID=UPI0039FC7B78